MAHLRLTRRRLIMRFGGATLAGAFGAQLLAACSSPAPTPAAQPSPPAAPPTARAAAAPAPASFPKPPPAAAAQVSAPTAPVAQVISRSGRLALPLYMPPNSPPPDVPGGAITPP